MASQVTCRELHAKNVKLYKVTHGVCTLLEYNSAHKDDLDGTDTQFGWLVPVRYRYVLDNGPDAWLETLTGEVIVAGDGTVVGWDLPTDIVTSNGTISPIGADELAAAIAAGNVGHRSSDPRTGPFNPTQAHLAATGDTPTLTWWWVVALSDHPNAQRAYVNAAGSTA